MVAEVLVLVWGLVVAIARLVPGPAGQPIRAIATVYTDIFRGLPAIICIYLVGFGLPLTGLPIIKDFPPEWYAILALTLTYGAYVAEVYRAGIESVHWSQTAAARSLGLSFCQTLRYVIVPQAVRRIIPPLLNDFICAAEGHGAGQRHRRHRRLQPGEDRRQQPLQPVLGDHGRLPLRRSSPSRRPASSTG